MEPIEDLSSWTSDKPQKQATAKAACMGNFQHQYLSELLVNVYSYRSVMKVCPTAVCVHERWIFSDPAVTFEIVASYILQKI